MIVMPLITRLRVLVSENPIAFLTVNGMLNVPATVGIPEINPVVVFKVKPDGMAPDHVNGFVPLALSVKLYETPATPPGRFVVVIVGSPTKPFMEILRAFVSLP